MKKLLCAIIGLLVFCSACGNDTLTPSVTFPEGTIENSFIEEEEQDLLPLEEGTYTFYNPKSGLYLSNRDGNLELSAEPTNWTLKEFSKEYFYVYAHGTDLLLDIDNAYVNPGNEVKLWVSTGYDVQIWNFVANQNGTYTIAYSGDNLYCLDVSDGTPLLQIRDKNCGGQEWIAVDVTDTIPKEYLSFKSVGDVIEIQLPLDILSVISEERILQWANEMELMYYSYYELTGFIPYEKIIVEAYKPCKYFAYVSDNCNVIRFGVENIYSEMEKMAARDCDWNFCVLHEMGHMFDSQRPWKFEAEVLTDFKLAYVLEKYGVAAAPAEFSASEVFYGKDITKAYDRLGGDFSYQYDVYSIAKRFLEIKEETGWEPFIETFHYMQENEAAYYGTTNLQKFENFISVFESFSGKDVKSYFNNAEWNTIINKISS
ncbi:MAG: RICIN domain-containing protein [Oscillospiraceae bacterium]|nr:RICIN domain-containing protein [Oscillospiraceae bacterium]